MNLNDLLRAQDIDPKLVLVFRHRPFEPELNRWLPYIAAEKPDVFNAYQQTQGEKVERVMKGLEGKGYVASFLGREPGKALFIGLYSIMKSKPLTYEQYWRVPAYKEMKKLGMKGFSESESRTEVLWFDLQLTEFYANWKGKLTIGFPPPERSWWRRAHNNDMPVLSVLEESDLDAYMPDWNELTLTWGDLHILPTTWKAALKEWRGVYYIFDTSINKGYVGSASGKNNLLGRWLDYKRTGDGGNRLLKKRDAEKFMFSILERVSPDMKSSEINEIESSWKERLHTRHPFGLNNN